MHHPQSLFDIFFLRPRNTVCHRYRLFLEKRMPNSDTKQTVSSSYRRACRTQEGDVPFVGAGRMGGEAEMGLQEAREWGTAPPIIHRPQSPVALPPDSRFNECACHRNNAS